MAAVLLAMWPAAWGADTARRFYVAPNGNDGWSGTLPAPNAGRTDGPLATLTAARDAVRRLKAAGPLSSPLVVMLLAGTYRLANPFALEPRDSGTEACPVTYTAFPGHRAIVSGGLRIRNWKPYRGAIMQAPVPGTAVFRQLYWNGSRPVRARWANRDAADPLYGGWAFIDALVPPGAKGAASFRYSAPAPPKRWSKPSQVEVSIFPWLCWVNDVIPLGGTDAQSRTIRLTRPPRYDYMELMRGNRFVVQNALEELDQPGEWSFDSETRTVYFWPPRPLRAGDTVTAPLIDVLFEARGTPADPVRHIRISRLEFTETWSPFPERQHPSTHHSPTLRGEAVRLENAQDCRVDHNEFRELGGDGIRLEGHTARNRITGNEIAFVGGSGVTVAGGSEQNTNEPADKAALARYSGMYARVVRNVISDNRIHHCGVMRKNCAGVQFFALNSVDNVISHNLIHDMSDKGMTMQDGYGRFIVEYNELHRLALEISDTGGIMVNRWYPLEGDPELSGGIVIRHNIVRDVVGCGAYGKPREGSRFGTRAGGRIWTPYYAWGIYSDNSGTGITVFGNLVMGTVLGGICIPVGEPSNNVFENNILVDSMAQQADLRVGAGARGNRFVRNIMSYSDPGAALLNIDSHTAQGFAECDYNLYFQRSGAPFRIRGSADNSFAAWKAAGFDRHSAVADPLFVDAPHGDYRLKPGSEAFRLGFQPLDFAEVGPRRAKAAASARSRN